MNNAISLFKLLGDETRYKIICSLYHSDSYVELLAENLGLTQGTVCFHLKKLENAGIVKCSRSQFYIIYSLNRSILSQTIENMLQIEKSEDKDKKYKQKVISSFFIGKRLKNIPVQEKKRLIVLEKIMCDFTKETYQENEVNQVLKLHYDDYCTLRRWLISEGFMTRKNDIYTVLERK